MPTAVVRYPFAPKSTRPLKRGQFLAIPLASGRFGAGCVVGQHMTEGKPSQRIFIAGVVRWVGTHEPSATDIDGLPLVAFGFAHLKVITESSGLVLGEACPELADSPSKAEALSLPTWGFDVPKRLLESVANAG
jgi:hypothetical protein